MYKLTLLTSNQTVVHVRPGKRPPPVISGARLISSLRPSPLALCLCWHPVEAPRLLVHFKILDFVTASSIWVDSNQLRLA